MGRQKRWFPELTNEQKEKLRKLRQQGLTAKKISDFDMLGLPHRTTNNIQINMRKLGLVGKNRSFATKSRKRFNCVERQKFDDFLLKNSLDFTPRQIAERFGVKKDTVTSRQRFLGIKARLVQNSPKIPFEKYIAEREKQLDSLAQELRQQKRIVPFEDRRCKRCGKVWLRHKKFFFHTIHKTNCGTSWNFWLVCVVCTSKERHQKKVAQYQRKHSQQLE